MCVTWPGRWRLTTRSVRAGTARRTGSLTASPPAGTVTSRFSAEPHVVRALHGGTAVTQAHGRVSDRDRVGGVGVGQPDAYGGAADAGAHRHPYRHLGHPRDLRSARWPPSPRSPSSRAERPAAGLGGGRRPAWTGGAVAGATVPSSGAARSSAAEPCRRPVSPRASGTAAAGELGVGPVRVVGGDIAVAVDQQVEPAGAGHVHVDRGAAVGAVSTGVVVRERPSAITWKETLPLSPTSSSTPAVR